jgi:hypothetical protein
MCSLHDLHDSHDYRIRNGVYQAHISYFGWGAAVSRMRNSLIIIISLNEKHEVMGRDRKEQPLM